MVKMIKRVKVGSFGKSVLTGIKKSNIECFTESIIKITGNIKMTTDWLSLI